MVLVQERHLTPQPIAQRVVRQQVQEAAAEVAEDGSSVALTVELPGTPAVTDRWASIAREGAGNRMSFGFIKEPAMTPHMALRRLEALIASTDAPKAKLDEAEACLQVLWKHVLQGA